MLYNIYSKSPETLEILDWNTPIPRLLEALGSPGRHLVVGDFNLYHLFWGGLEETRQYLYINQLVYLAKSGQLDLLLEPGTITRERQGNRPAILDLAFSLPNLTPWVTSCKIGSFLDSDYYPIETIIQISSPASPQATRPRYNFKKLDYQIVVDGAKWLQILELGPGPSPTLQVIDQYSDYLIRFILALISKTVPVYNPSQKQQPWWLLAILEAINLKRRARCL